MGDQKTRQYDREDGDGRFEREAKLSSDGVEKKEGVAPRGVDLRPLHLSRQSLAKRARANSKEG